MHTDSGGKKNITQEDIDPIFNFLTLETDILPEKNSFKYDTKVYTIPVGKAFQILLDSMSLFVRNSKLITDFVHYFRVKRKFHRPVSSNTTTNSSGNMGINVGDSFGAPLSPLGVIIDYESDNDDGNDTEGACDIRDVEIVCLEEEEGEGGEEDEEVEDIFGTTTVLPGTRGRSHVTTGTDAGIVNSSDNIKTSGPGRKKLSFTEVDAEAIPPEGEVYAQLVQVFALSAATLVMSQVYADHCLLACLLSCVPLRMFRYVVIVYYY